MLPEIHDPIESRVGCDVTASNVATGGLWLAEDERTGPGGGRDEVVGGKRLILISKGGGVEGKGRDRRGRKEGNRKRRIEGRRYEEREGKKENS